MMSEVTRVAIQAPITIAMSSTIARLQFYNIAQGLLHDFDRVTAERDALQLRLNAADQRIDELTTKPSDAECERLMEIIERYPNGDPLPPLENSTCNSASPNAVALLATRQFRF
ncbi:hypothetical protein [Pseudomonas sp. ZS1P83]